MTLIKILISIAPLSIVIGLVCLLTLSPEYALATVLLIAVVGITYMLIYAGLSMASDYEKKLKEREK